MSPRPELLFMAQYRDLFSTPQRESTRPAAIERTGPRQTLAQLRTCTAEIRELSDGSLDCRWRLSGEWTRWVAVPGTNWFEEV